MPLVHASSLEQHVYGQILALTGACVQYLAPDQKNCESDRAETLLNLPLSLQFILAPENDMAECYMAFGKRSKNPKIRAMAGRPVAVRNWQKRHPLLELETMHEKVLARFIRVEMAHNYFQNMGELSYLELIDAPLVSGEAHDHVSEPARGQPGVGTVSRVFSQAPPAGTALSEDNGDTDEDHDAPLKASGTAEESKEQPSAASTYRSGAAGVEGVDGAAKKSSVVSGAAAASIGGGDVAAEESLSGPAAASVGGGDEPAEDTSVPASAAKGNVSATTMEDMTDAE